MSPTYDSVASKRSVKFPDNPIRGLGSLAQIASAKGIDVIPLNIGAPDTPTSKVVTASAIEFLSKAQAITYGPSEGDSALKSELVKFYSEKMGINGIGSENIMITQGASEALDLVLYTIADEGDEILTPDPCYPNYLAIAYRHNIKMQPIPTKLQDGFHLARSGESKNTTTARILRQVTAKTKAIIWSSPCNPTGATLREDELAILSDVADKTGITLISDEVYRTLSFDLHAPKSKIRRAPSILDVRKGKKRTNCIVLDSASKMLGFCGGRMGTVIGEKKLIDLLVRQASVRGSASTISQAALLGINRIDLEYFSTFRTEFKSRRDFLHQGLKKLSHLSVTVSPHPPEGAFYIVADLGESLDAAHFCKWLLTDYTNYSDKTIFLTPMRMGTGGFYLNPVGKSQVRIAYVINKERLTLALNILENSLSRYHKLFPREMERESN